MSAACPTRRRRHPDARPGQARRGRYADRRQLGRESHPQSRRPSEARRMSGGAQGRETSARVLRPTADADRADVTLDAADRAATALPSTSIDTGAWLRAILTAPVYDVARRTPLDVAARLSTRLGASVLLKREDLQPVFSFKLRGAYNALMQLTPEQRARGVLAVSAGNHAQGVALGAQRLGIDAVIVMPATTPRIKTSAVEALGARIVRRDS